MPLSSYLRGAGVNDKATFLLIHRLVYGVAFVLALGLGFGLLLALSVRGPLFYPWLVLVVAAFSTSYVVWVFDGYDPWGLPSEWESPETWLTVLGIGMFAWLFHEFCRTALVGGTLRPNLSLNADVPHAGLRPGSGPPVS